jgi:hypothetical protein
MAQSNTTPASLLPAVQLQQQAPAQEAVIDIQTDAKQQLWLLSRQGNLYQGTASALLPRWKVPKDMATGYFHCLLPEFDAFWLCTDRGLLKLSPDLQQAELLGLSWGLPDLRVMGITRTQHFIWVLTRKGLMAFKPDGSAIHLLAPRQELNFSAAQLRGISSLTVDTVQLATSEGLWQIDITELTPVRKNMQLHLTELRLNQQLFTLADLSQSIRLPDYVEELQLKFKLLSYQPHLNVDYFYRWQGQQDWIELGKDAVLTLGQLAPGQHSLHLMAQAGGQQIQTQAVLFTTAGHFCFTIVSGLQLAGSKVTSSCPAFGPPGHTTHSRAGSGQPAVTATVQYRQFNRPDEQAGAAICCQRAANPAQSHSSTYDLSLDGHRPL